MQIPPNPLAARAVVIGAGMGGLAAAIRLAAAGCRVQVVELADVPGGKARARATAAGPAAMGPTVLTMRAEVDALFALAGTTTDAEVTLTRLPHLARHWWPGGGRLDLMPDPEANIEAISAFAGPDEAAAFARFDACARALYQAFEGPVMRAPRPALAQVAQIALRKPGLWPALLPGVSVQRYLRGFFRDPRLVQLFGRYATYVGGRPAFSPAVLSLVWHAEAQGVWALPGGMQDLAWALARAAERLGVTFRYATRARRVVRQAGHVTGVEIEGGETLPCDIAVFNGDPRALQDGLLGDAAREAIARADLGNPSLSAWVWAFAAQAQGPRADDLLHHNIFFAADPALEFGPIARGDMPVSPTLYICAQDRELGPRPPQERFEIIMNAPSGRPALPDEDSLCRTRSFLYLQAMGLTFDPTPGRQALTRPADLAARFPASQGAIYGQSPEGMMAAFRRPPSRTGLPGLYLAGGGVHPGAGVPMAMLSGRQASAQAVADLTSGCLSRPADTPGGMLTESLTRARARFRS